MLEKLLINTDKRSVAAYRNILGLFVLKGINIAISLLMVPIALNYLDTTRYGIWITLSAIFNWFSLFDIGLGNGLRNRLAEALAHGEILKARTYISVTYASLILIFIGVFILFFITNLFIDWTVILNTSAELSDELQLLAGIVFFFFCMRFVTQLIVTIALAKQEPAFSQFLDVFGRTISLVGIYLLTIFTSGNLIYLAVTLTALPVVSLLVISLFIFRGRYQEIRPSLSLVHFRELRFILDLGVKFFLIQIAGIIFYQTNNILIAQFFGPEEVTPYAVTYQYLNILNIVFIIILTPYWSAFTQAFARDEINWIKKEVRKLKYIWTLFLILMVIALFLARFLIDIWVGNKVAINLGLACAIAFYLILTTYNSINCNFLNGVGKIKIQLYIAVGFSFIHIPLAIYFCKSFGIIGIMFSAIVNVIITTVVYEIQYYKIVSKTATGIWNA